MILDFHALHVLSADIENKVDARKEFLCRLVMRHRLDDSVVGSECSLNKTLSISGNGRICNVSIRRKHTVKFVKHQLRSFQRITFVVSVERIYKVLVLIDQRGLGCSRSGIDSEEQRPLAAS